MPRYVVVLALVLTLMAPAGRAATATAAVPLTASTRLPSEGLQADADLLDRTYRALHPGIYRYNTPAQYRHHLSALRDRLRGDPTLAQAYLAFSEFAASLRCGHTYANFSNQPAAVTQALFEGSHRVPFEFRWLRGRMIVTRNLSSEPYLVRGTTVVAVNGIPTKTILRRLLPLVPADGNNDAKRIATLQVQGNERWEAFDIFLPMAFPTVEVGTELELTVLPPGSTYPRVVRVPALWAAQRLAARTAPDTKTNAPAWTVTFPHDDIAVLTMPSWALFDSQWDWRHFLTNLFTELQRRRMGHLIIDLRMNSGGLNVGDVLLAHLTPKPLTFDSYERRVRYRRVPSELAPYLQTWDTSFLDWGPAATRINARYYRLTRLEDGARQDRIEPEAPTFTGTVHVLVGPANSSATFGFAERIQRSGLATLVGQTTGGSRRGINGGAFFFLHLPHSGIELDVPLIGQFPRTSQPDTGIVPDRVVVPNAADIAAGRDTEMDAVLAELTAQTQPGSRASSAGH